MAQGNAIPTSSRLIVKERDDGTCQRCGVGANAWHHRRRRGVKHGHFQHCPCIGVMLCTTCHTWVHANPAKAMETGFIISSHEDEPWKVPLRIFGTYWVVNDCYGEYDFAPNGDKINE